jgi:hypothetical protein
MRDLDELALAMPEATKEISEDGRPSYLVHGKMFCFHRGRRPDAVDAETGERLDDVLMFRVDGPEEKELVLADARGIFFTTPHFNGYSAVLIRIPDLAQLDRTELREIVVDAWLTRAQRRLIPDLAQLDRTELREIVVDAWLTRAQRRLAKAWLSEHD